MNNELKQSTTNKREGEKEEIQNEDFNTEKMDSMEGAIEGREKIASERLPSEENVLIKGKEKGT